MKFSIVIPNYNGSHLLKKNLPKVIKAAEDAEIIVVDDASTDDSLKILKTSFPEVRVVRHRTNQRFAIACNSGVNAARGNIIVLLNSDVFPELDFLQPMRRHFEDEQMFAVGCMEIVGEKTRGKSTGKFQQGMLVHAEAQDRKPGPTLWAFGGSGAFSHEKWLKLGGMDALFRPAYWEDIDLSYRAWKRGWKVVFEPKSRVYHQPESTNISAFGRARIRRIASKNQLLFVWKNITDSKLIVSHLIWFPLRLLVSVVKGDGAFLWGSLHALWQLPEAVRKRHLEKQEMKVTDESLLKLFEEDVR